MTAPRVHVLLFAADARPGGVAEAYHRISADLLGTPGLVRNTLLQRDDAPDRFVVHSEWESMDAFRRWEEGAEHRSATAPLRPYQDRSAGLPFGIYTVAGEYAA